VGHGHALERNLVTPPRTAQSPEPTSPAAVVRPLAFVTDAELVSGLVERDRAAIEAFYDRYAGHVMRVLARILGAEPELDDLHHEVFVRALESIDSLVEPSAARAWLTSVAVFTAKTCIQQRVRRRWLRFLSPDELPEVEAASASEEITEAIRATYWALDRLPAEERIPFALRVIDGMELTDIASACGASLSTIKRRIGRGETKFLAIARRHPVLSEWLEGGARWGVTQDR
jgi:RNA polymerase sigma-70 factor (ECF subfamily)